jgi:hypothetical protein
MREEPETTQVRGQLFKVGSEQGAPPFASAKEKVGDKQTWTKALATG